MKKALLLLGKVLAWLLLATGLYVGLSFLLSVIPVNRSASAGAVWVSISPLM